MLKKVLIALVVLVVVVAGALYLLYSNLGPILKAAIEKYGSAATQSQVKVDSVTLSASSGQGTITGLIVDNPKGFTTPHAFELNSIGITINTSTLTQNPIEVSAVTIAAPHVTYEQGDSGGNLQKLQQNVTQFAGRRFHRLLADRRDHELRHFGRRGAAFLLADIGEVDGGQARRERAAFQEARGDRDLTLGHVELVDDQLALGLRLVRCGGAGGCGRCRG